MTEKKRLTEEELIKMTEEQRDKDNKIICSIIAGVFIIFIILGILF